MPKITTTQVKEIAGHLDAGEFCYIHPETGEIGYVFNFEQMGFDLDEYLDTLDSDDRDAEEARIEELEENWIAIEPMDSKQSYRTMEAFAEVVSDSATKAVLFRALLGKKPFAAFKNAVDHSGYVRQQWFDFKDEAYVEWLLNQLEAEGIVVVG